MNNTKLSKNHPQLTWFLNQKAKKDPLPVAIILVESEFRPYIVRIIEYLYFIWCLFFNKKRVLSLSLGPSQVQYRFWLEFFNNSKSEVEIARLFEDPETNYNLVEWYIGQSDIHNLLDLSEVYTGKKNRYYASKLLQTLETLRSEHFAVPSRYK